MKHIIGLVAMLLPIICGAQSPPVRALSVGDTVPDIVFNHVINYKDSTARLSDFKGKLVILDFWAVWCGSCIAGFPKLDSLQKEFDDKIQILLLNGDLDKFARGYERRGRDFFENWETRYKMPFILPYTLIGDKLMRQVFPHNFIPHYVWIGPQGKVIAITSSTEVTAKNIEAVLNRRPNQMPVKVDSLKFHHQN